MNNVNKIVFLFIGLLLSPAIWGQSGTDRLKKEQQELEKQIATTKVLLEKSKENTQLSLEEIKLISQQVAYRERLLQNINNQIRSSELKIEQKESKIQELNAKIEQLKKQYKKLLIYAYKNRNKYGKLMYIFSAESVEEALKRKLYLEKLGDIQKKQVRLIEQNKALLNKEIKELEKERKKQLKLADKKKEERLKFIEAKKEKEAIFEKYNQQQEKLEKELLVQKEKKEKIEKAIQRAIQKEIEAERERQRKIREAKRRAEETRRKENDNTVSPDKETLFPETAEAIATGENFISNKGKLPWPVSKGTITSGYGKQKHPTLSNVYIQNNGLDISTTLNANVLSVFKGVVTSVFNISGAGKVVIIKHGNYRTVYANLQDVYVTKGSKVDIKTPIGSLLPNKSGDISVVHFEIHKVLEEEASILNPNLWIAQ